MRKYSVKITAAIILMVVAGCESKVTFEEPQPFGKRNLNAFPGSYIGEYRSISDGSLLVINADMAYEKWNDEFRIHRSAMQETFDTVYTTDTDVQLTKYFTLHIDVEGDSAFITSQGIDTIFTIGTNQILRKYNGYLFLNQQVDETSWSVNLLKLENGFLEFEELVSLDEIDSLEQIVDISRQMDSSETKVEKFELNPTRRELRQILAGKEMTRAFVRVK